MGLTRTGADPEPQHEGEPPRRGRPRYELKRLVRQLEARQPGTHGHSRRVAAHAAAIATELGLSAPMVARVRTAALLHDVGKIETPASIVDKPGALDEAELRTIRRHPGAGARLVNALGDEGVTAIVRHHHERFDGLGYPAGLSGYEIPLGARIVAVADTFDALTSYRPYRVAMSERRALELLEDGAGSQFDPTLVRVALRLAEPRRRQRRPGRLAARPDAEAAAASAPLPLRPPG
jgi:putative nucleotidyltransferase with HDIG domain